MSQRRRRLFFAVLCGVKIVNVVLVNAGAACQGGGGAVTAAAGDGGVPVPVGQRGDVTS